MFVNHFSNPVCFYYFCNFVYPVLRKPNTTWHRYVFAFVCLRFWSSVTTLIVENILKIILKMFQ